MYRILVVDDEELITDSLAYMLETTELFELDVYKAYSANEALGYLDKYAFDIIISDIQMPGMTGIELLKEIHQKWPSSQVVFLTGHDSFDYAYKAIQYHATRYILKNEGDDVLLSAIGDCIAVIDKDAHNTGLLSLVEAEVHSYQPIIRRDFLQSILVGRLPELQELKREFERLEVCLDISQPVMLLAARISEIPREDMIASIDIVLRDKIGHVTRSEIAWVNSNSIAWIIQSAAAQGLERTKITIKGMAESIQRVCAGTMNVKISFIFDSSEIRWFDLAKRFSILHHTLEYKLEQHPDVAIAGLEFFLGELYSTNQINKAGLTQYREIVDKIAVGMANNDSKNVGLYTNWLAEVLSNKEIKNTLYVIELNTELRLMLLTFVTKHELQDIFQNDDEFRLFLADTNMEDINWFVDRFKSLTERMMSLCQQEQGKSTEVFIHYLLEYMSTNLDADLSLCALSEKVYLNPSYLSRRFKELTGKNIIDTITVMRVSAACRYLEDKKYKISKIAPMVGYESAAHFSRVFKKQIGMTPQDYRDKNAYK